MDAAGAEIRLAAAELERGQLSAAIAACERALAHRPGLRNALIVLQEISQRQARAFQFKEMVQTLRVTLAHFPSVPELHFTLGSAAFRSGDWRLAADALGQAARLRPDWLDAYYYLATVLQAHEDYPRAADAWREVIRLQPDHGSAHFNLGAALEHLGDADGARRSFESARQSPPSAMLCNDLGKQNLDAGRIDRAIADFEKAIELDDTFFGAWSNLGLALVQKGRVRESVGAFQKALKIDPLKAEIHWNLSASLLALGDFPRGLAEYESRFQCHEFISKNVHRPRWQGENLSGKSLLLFDEQGYGDTIQFIRYAPILAKRAAKILLLCNPKIATLLQRVPGISQVVPEGESCPWVDCQAPLASLPYLTGMTLETIPANVPYMSAEPDLAAKWETKLTPRNGRRRIGIAWIGNAKPNPLRSMPHEYLGLLTGFENFTFHSLHKQVDKPVGPPGDLPIQDFSREINDFADLAALITNMDLILTIDTAAAHLAGAMGKPTWTLLPFAADWRWLLERTDSPWYPTMRLFRQPCPGDWAGVISRVVEELGGY